MVEATKIKKGKVVKSDIQRAIAKIKKLDVKQKELQTKADQILSTSAVGQAPPVYHRTLDKAIEVTKKKAQIWNDEIRNKVIPGTGRTYWQVAVESRFPTVGFGKEEYLDFFAEDIEAMSTPVTPEVTKLTGDIWNRMTPSERDQLGIKAGLDAEERGSRWIELWPEKKRAVIREFKKEKLAIPKAPVTPGPKAEKGKATIEEIKGWPEAKKAWVRQEANKLTAKGLSPAIQELGMAYDKAQVKKRAPEPKVEKPPRLTVRPKTYRGEEGYTVKGERTDIFFSEESQAREYVKRVKAGERSDQVLSDIWGIKQVRSGYTIAELIQIHAKRSPQSQASDERQSHRVTIEPDSPKVKQWITDPGRADIRGVDTPPISKRSSLGRKGTQRITPKTPKLRR